MASHKRLKSVVQSIAHHAVGALSVVHPHLGQACKEAGIDSIEVHVSEYEPCPSIFQDIEPLRLALNSLKDTFYGLVVTEGFGPQDIESAKLVFEFKHGQLDHYCSVCTASLVCATKTYQSKVNYFGNTEPTSLGNRTQQSCAVAKGVNYLGGAVNIEALIETAKLLGIIISLFVAVVGLWKTLAVVRVKIEAETRLKVASEIETQIKLLDLFSQLMDVAHARSGYHFSDNYSLAYCRAKW